MYIYIIDLLSCLVTELFLLRDQLLDFESRHAAAASAGDRLAVALILHVTRRVHALDRRLRRPRDGDDVPVLIGLHLLADDAGSGLVTDGVEETVDREVLLLAGLDVLDAQVVQELAIALALGRDRVPEDGLRSNAALAIRAEVCGSAQAIDSRSWGC